ncbi:MAG: rhodanese-like domain-containing protein [Puniceicoccaceae bacterium]|nr:MAG: rhodanese-like domain-containing protein [Puniceicoccaceae bacterium]
MGSLNIGSTIVRQCLVILALSLTGAAYSLVSGTAPLPWAKAPLAPGEIRLADAQALDVIWIDARSLEAFEQAHAPGALFIDEGDWDTGLLELMDHWLTEPRAIVVYCGSESCDTSQRVADRLREALPEAEIYSLKGGWDAWQ